MITLESGNSQHRAIGLRIPVMPFVAENLNILNKEFVDSSVFACEYAVN